MYLDLFEQRIWAIKHYAMLKEKSAKNIWTKAAKNSVQQHLNLSPTLPKPFLSNKHVACKKLNPRWWSWKSLSANYVINVQYQKKIHALFVCRKQYTMCKMPRSLFLKGPILTWFCQCVSLLKQEHLHVEDACPLVHTRRGRITSFHAGVEVRQHWHPLAVFYPLLHKMTWWKIISIVHR